MDEGLRNALIRVLPFVALAFLLPFIARKRGLRLGEDLRLVAPRPAALATWVVVFAAWMAATELATRAMGVAAPEPWIAKYSGPVVALRLAGIVLLAPFVEELAFRGLLFRLLGKWAGPPAAVVGSALLFAALHFQYDFAGMAFVFTDGLLFAVARLRGDSLWIPIAMHTLGNAYAGAQRLGLA
jgi:membrane protease YdiL (CAAX protease family)